jgi:DNA-binding response OmpR family regulator
MSYHWQPRHLASACQNTQTVRMTYSEHSQHAEYSGCVVVVDDNVGLRQMLALALETAGFDVIEAGDEVELQRHLARSQPDAVLIDLQRSEAEGLQLLTRMRARQTLCNVPILFLAGSDADDFRHQAMRAGADWFGLRPVGMLDLQNQVAELIRNGRPTIERAPRQKRQHLVPLKRTG